MIGHSDDSRQVRRAKGRAARVAVTPVRIDGGTLAPVDRPPGIGLVPSDAVAPVALRSALDWATVLSRRPVTPARWDELVRAAEYGGAELVPCDGETLPLEWRRVGVDLIGRSVAGVHVLLRAPSRVPGAPVSVATCDGCGTLAAGYADRASDPCELRPLPSVRARDLWHLEGRAHHGRCEAFPSTLEVCAEGGGIARPELTAEALQALQGDVAADRRDVYGVEVQLQGTLFSAVESGGGELAARVWGSLAAYLWRDLIGPNGWRYALAWADPDTRIGRFDLATDVMFPGAAGALWSQWGIYAHGDHDGAFKRWSMRARARRTEETVRADAAATRAGESPVSGRRVLLGKETAGRTLYAGSAAYALLCVYERSKKTDGDFKVLGPTLRACGWDGSSEVVRSEVRLSRAWARDQVVRAPDGSPRYTAREEHQRADGTVRELVRPRTVAEITFAEWIESLPVLAREVSTRFRHTDPSQTCRVRDRDSSVWWRAVENAALRWTEGRDTSVGAIVSVRRDASLAHTVTRARAIVARLVALRGAHHARDVIREVLDAYDDPHWRGARDASIARTRSRFAIEDPDGASALAARAVEARARAAWVPLTDDELAAAI